MDGGMLMVRRRRTRLAILLIGLALAVLIAVFRATYRPAPPPGVISFEVASREHVLGTVPYDQRPPVGGDHAAQWLNCGFYAETVPDENAVHTLEHGAVWIAFRPDLPADQVETLRKLAREEADVLVSPYPNLAAPVVATAWAHQLRLESATDPRLVQFVSAFRHAASAPERAACTGGIGSPTG